jgi:putative membrane protein insertion efficiency factor
MAHSENFAVASPPVGPGARVGVTLVRAYQLLLGPFLGGACRFDPSCSEYAIQALVEHGFCRGATLAARRIARCHPFGHAGSDPVPPRSSMSERR